MTENKGDTLATEFVLQIISRQEWVDEEVLMMYEECYRLTKRLMIFYKEDTTELDKVRNEIMSLYGQI